MLKSFFRIVASMILICANLSGLACEKKEGTVDVNHLMESRCSTCHFSTNIYAVVKTPEEWSITVERMRRINPELMSEKESALITTYLQNKLVVANTPVTAREN